MLPFLGMIAMLPIAENVSLLGECLRYRYQFLFFGVDSIDGLTGGVANGRS